MTLSREELFANTILAYQVRCEIVDVAGRKAAAYLTRPDAGDAERKLGTDLLLALGVSEEACVDIAQARERERKRRLETGEEEVRA